MIITKPIHIHADTHTFTPIHMPIYAHIFILHLTLYEPLASVLSFLSEQDTDEGQRSASSGSGRQTSLLSLILLLFSLSLQPFAYFSSPRLLPLSPSLLSFLLSSYILPVTSPTSTHLSPLLPVVVNNRKRLMKKEKREGGENEKSNLSLR